MKRTTKKGVNKCEKHNQKVFGIGMLFGTEHLLYGYGDSRRRR